VGEAWPTLAACGCIQRRGGVWPLVAVAAGGEDDGKETGLQQRAVCGAATRVNRTGGNQFEKRGNRSYRSGSVPVPAGSQPVQIQNLNLNSKK
jgi:hypothetical protein